VNGQLRQDRARDPAPNVPVVVAVGYDDAPTLRSLDAIHLATAQVLTNESGAELLAFVTYDRRLLDAAKAAGLPTASPGQD
jgi:predicted nucleic acid-binding protein